MIDAAIIGAGPYGLSLAAHLRATGVNFRIFGKPMESWKHGMPPGMLLKSHAWSSCLYDPDSALTLEKYCAERGLYYHDSLMKLPLETFIQYGEAFQQRFAPNLAEKTLSSLSSAPGGFRAVFDDGEVVEARRVVLALGVRPFKHVPPILSGLPSDRVSHSGDYGPLDGLDGREVVVLGSGASAIDLAALLHERGVAVSMLARSAALTFAPEPVPTQTWPQRLLRPWSGIGNGWFLWTCANAPGVIHALPHSLRRGIVRKTLGPLGGAPMKERILGKVPLRLGCDLKFARAAGDRVQLEIRTREGAPQTLLADHVIAATGYRTDLDRLGFLAPELRRRIRTVEGAPVLSADYETSAPGLHVIGPASADSFGPVARFAFGAIHPSRRLAHRFAAEASRPVRIAYGERSLAVSKGGLS